MGHNYLQLVKKFFLGLLAFTVVVLGGCKSESGVALDDSSYKPAIKVAGTAYGETMDIVSDIDVNDYEYLGQVEHVHEEPGSEVRDDEPDFTSNDYPKGSKLYRYSPTEILAETPEGDIALFEWI